MSNEEILKFAEEANFLVRDGVIYYGNVGLQTCLTKFAALVHEAAVRATAEDCAKVCDIEQREAEKELLSAKEPEYFEGKRNGAEFCADAIRTKYQLK